jgi:hypothetical protein
MYMHSMYKRIISNRFMAEKRATKNKTIKLRRKIKLSLLKMEIYKVFTAKGEPVYYINRFFYTKFRILFIINVEKKI